MSRVATEKYKEKRLSKIKEKNKKRLDKFNEYVKSVKDNK